MSRVQFELIPDGVQEKEVSVNGISTQYWEIGDGEPMLVGGLFPAAPIPVVVGSVVVVVLFGVSCARCRNGCVRQRCGPSPCRSRRRIW